MGQITYTFKYKKNEGLVVSPEELASLYLYGVDIRSRDGSVISNDSIKMFILSAQREIETYLEIRFNLTFEQQTVSYFRDDYWGGFPIIRTKLPVVSPLSVIGYLNNIQQIKYPQDWLNTKKDSEGYYFKKIHLIPTGSTTSRANADIILTGITAYLGLTAYGQLPNYFTTQYITGFSYDQLPIELVNVVGKMASLSVLGMLGDIPLGAPGVTGISLGMDGLSQNVTTTLSSGNGAFGGRIKQYTDEINRTLSRVKLIYKSLNISSL